VSNGDQKVVVMNKCLPVTSAEPLEVKPVTVSGSVDAISVPTKYIYDVVPTTKAVPHPSGGVVDLVPLGQDELIAAIRKKLNDGWELHRTVVMGGIATVNTLLIYRRPK